MKRRISIDEAMMSSLGLVSEYENTDINKINKVASSVKETVIEKYAGIFINNPTQENIEDFIRKYMYNELTFFPRILELIVDFIPSAFDKSHKDYVSEGTGVVGVKIHHKVIELPFLVREGELEPFDVIQMDGQRAPYSRENLQKIILNLDKQIQDEQNAVASGGEQSPYAGLEDYNNAATTPGFMGDVLAIRDSQSLRRGAGMYVTAGDYDYGFEKEAGSKAEDKLYPFSQRNRGSLEAQFDKAVAKAENEKPTTKAPKGTVEGEKKEEKLAGISQEALLKDYMNSKDYKTHTPTERESIIADIKSGALKDNDPQEMAQNMSNTERKQYQNTMIAKGHGQTVKDLQNNFPKKAEIITDLNSLLDKTASIKPMTDDELESIAYILSKKAHEEFKARLDKIANEVEEPTRKEMEIIEKKASFKFTDASQMKHGEFIVFPEIDGSDVNLTPAVVLSDIDTSMVNKKGKEFKFVCSIDGRIKVLDGDKFLCAKADDRAFKLATTGLASLKIGDTFFALKGNKALPPSSIQGIVEPRVGQEGVYTFDKNSINKICNIFECTTIDLDSKKDIYFSNPERRNRDDIGSWRKGKFAITTMDGKKFENTSIKDFLEAKSKETGLPQEKINAVIPRWSIDTEDNGGNIFTTDMQSPVIKIKGVITTNFKTQEEYDTKSRLHEAGYDVEKVAFTTNQVTVYCVDRKQNIFNMTVEYRDTEERFMNLRKQIFNRISKGKLKAILRILKFEGNTVSEVVFKAKNEQKAQYPIPASCTIENIKEIEGGDVHNVSKETVKATVNKYVNPLTIAKGLALATSAGVLTDATTELVARHPGAAMKAADMIGGFSKLFSESAELSGAFEKAAQQYENEDFLDYARVLSLTGHFSEKVATVIKDTKNVYPSIKEAAHDIVMAKPVLEKFAYDLTALKVNQSMHKTEMVPSNIIRGAIENIDTLYKMAYGIDNSIDKSNLSFK